VELPYRPTLDDQGRHRRLDHLLVAGPLESPVIAARIERLSRAFRCYADSYPLPLWAPGLVINQEMAALSEALLPISEIRAVFDLVLRACCRFSPQLSGSYLHTSPTWLHFLDKFKPRLGQADPGAILRELCRDGERRTSFVFALMLPHHFGGGFDRYPLQTRWIRGWLADNFGRLGGRVKALDSACGSGEGTYGLAQMVAAAGYGGNGCHVDGSTVEAVELFAAAHAFFPHDRERQREYRKRVETLLGEEGIGMHFYLEDIGAEGGKGGYDLVLCNGLLGGPLMHGGQELTRAVKSLASRLAPGGVLLAADRFHAGWRQRVPQRMLESLMSQNGLEIVEVPEGVGGRRVNR
jgi:SAM-dependent methyltransferase